MRKRKKNVVYSLLNASKSAIFSAVEIHNKPQFLYRYPTVSMLIINAWELLLKAYIYKYISNSKIYEKDDKKHTIRFTKALTLVNDDINTKEGPKTFNATFANLDLIEQYRNTNVHYFEEELNPAIYMLLSRSVINYNNFLDKYFNKDITKESSLFILPIGFNIPFNPVDFLNKNYDSVNNDFVSAIIKCIKDLNDNDIQEPIIVGFDTLLTSVKNISNADIIAAINQQNKQAIPVYKAYRLTDDPNAPAIKSVEEILPDLEYKEYVKKILDKDNTIKQNPKFHEINKLIKEDNTLCKIRHLNPNNKKSAKQCFYYEAAVDKFIELYHQHFDSNWQQMYQF